VNPVASQQKIMNFVGENQLLEFDFLASKRFDQLHGFSERHVAVVVSMY